jgi:peptidoglycan/LPS O-acetylase OafA/YrhL
MPGQSIRTTSPSSAPPRQIPALTSLRFFAAWGIVVAHYSPALALPGGDVMHALLAMASTTATLFFVLSGFVLTLQYEQRLHDDHTGAAIATYRRARFARIAPLYWLTLLATLVAYAATDFAVSLGGDAQTGFKLLSFVINALALQAWVPDTTVQQFWNAPGWSISAELFFYLLLPTLLRWPVLSGSWASIGLVVAMSGLAAVGYRGAVLPLLPAEPEWLGYGMRLPLLSLPSFMLGIVLARRHLARPRRRSLVNSPLLPLLLLCTSALLLVKQGEPYGAHWIVTQTLWLPLFGWLVWCLADAPRRGTRWLAAGPLVLLGNASYALYLIQWLPLGFLLRGWFGEPPAPGLAALVMLALLPLSIALHLGFERPLQRWIMR